MDISPRNLIPFPTGGLWPAPAPDEDEENEEDDSWGEGAEDSGDVWNQPSPAAHEPADERGYGAPTGGGWGDPVPPTGGGWGAPPASSEWGQPPTPAGNGAYAMGRGNSRRGGAPTNAHPPTRAQAPAHTSLHPSAQAAAHTMSPAQGWGAPAPAAPEWGQPTQNWGQPAPPKPPAQKPAWANWANEAKMSQPQRHRQQQAAPPSRSQQTFHPSQQGHVDPHFLAEQQSIMRSIQETSGRGGGRHQQSRPQPVQYADSWNNWGRDTWGGDRASTIPEEDEEYEDDEWEDEGDDGWGGHGGGYGDGAQRERPHPDKRIRRSGRLLPSHVR
ncbi:hypothetical protein K466DRAFT_286950 [Polyporus arcularius HHB13444]|uniref:Uncharacterized protein n=1 Tax=Polyporus arcularius HHB13444 TaxID=1314778 RepID=A0A5C3PQT0_9APHY|nr:hypothetical protein K466DRAFT_286950 [Polyporus arcularius HHB13444]